MNFLDYFERLDYLLEMIEKGRVSSPKQIAQKFDCCNKTARNMINNLRDEGYKIEYSRGLRKYFIKNE